MKREIYEAALEVLNKIETLVAKAIAELEALEAEELRKEAALKKAA